MIPEYHVSTAAQFWSELEDILSVPAQASLEEIDLAMRTFVFFCARYYHEYLSSSNPELEYAVHEFDRALHMLLESHFYNSHSDRMVNIAMDLVEMRHSQDSQHGTTQLHLLLRLLIQHGTQKPHVFKLLRQPRMSASRQTSRPFIQMLIEVLNRTEEEAHASGENSSVEGMVGSDTTILLYEVLRVKRLSSEELPLFEEKFIRHLFEIIEQTRDGDEEYNYCLVRLIIALNEQFMVAGLENHSHSHGHGHHGNHKKSSLPTESHNLVLKIIKDKLGNSKTFGENLIFILNRLNSSGGEASPEDLCTSLLILKILYLLFSTSSTSEYFYTNDLRVLVDVFIRELLDLPEESEGLRHTYLRVLHPLMTNTQLRTYPYKHAELRSTLLALLSNEHIRTVSPTTRRLVERNLSAEWCTALDPPPTSTKVVQAEAQLAKEMSTMALKSPKVGLLKVEEGMHSNGQSTTSVNAVAGAEMSPARNRKISLSGFLGKNRASPKDPQQQQTQSADQPDRQPFHYRIRKPSSRGPNEQQSQLSGSVDSVLPSFGSKKSKVPPPRPPKSARSLETSQSLPGTPPESADSLSADDASIKTTRSRRAPPPTPSRKRGHTQSQPEDGQNP